jgi:DNA-binding NtrC family response regulator
MKNRDMSKDFGVLVVDDDRLGRVSTVRLLTSAGYRAEPADSGAAALKLLGDGQWDVVLTDLRMPGMDGLELLKEIRTQHPRVEVILMTAFGSVESAVEAMQLGATDYLLKPFSFPELDLRLKRVRSQLETRGELETLRGILGESIDADGFVGRSPEIVRMREHIKRFADSIAPVLITGETGTGKEVVARALHRQGRWSDGEFVAIGCGTIPHELAESELFGHERGAFTGAAKQRVGSFERANGGTLLLDDVDDLSLDLQVKLLRVLQEGTLTRVGGNREIEVDVRVVATTKVDLEKAAREGRFRPDLFYRLRGLEIRLPALRERGDDILLLANHFLRVAAIASDTPAKHLSGEATQILRRHPWPGNVRELRQAMESVMVLCPGTEVLAEHLPEFLQTTEPSQCDFSINLDTCDTVSFKDLTHRFERQLLDWALARADGRQTEAARLLQLPRTTFQSKLGSTPALREVTITGAP